MKRLWGHFEIGTYNVTVPGKNETELVTTSVAVDTGDVPQLMYKVPYQRSLICTNPTDWTLVAILHHDQDIGNRIKNATIVSRDLQFDIFRPKDAPTGVYRVRTWTLVFVRLSS